VGEPSDTERQALLARIDQLERALAESEAGAAHTASELVVQVERLEGYRQALERNLDWYADLFDHAPVAYLALDGAGLICDLNVAAAALLGGDRRRLIGWPLRLHVAPADRRKFLDHMHRCRRGGQVHTELSLRTGQGLEIPVNLISELAGVLHDTNVGYRAALIDLSERRAAERALERSTQRQTLALAASGAGSFEYEWPQAAFTASPAFAEILGVPLAEVPEGREFWAWLQLRLDPDEHAERQRLHAAFIAGEVASFGVEFRVRRGDGRWIWVRVLSHAADRAGDGVVTRVVGVLLDISLERQRIAEAERRAVQLRALSAALFRVEADERRELATLLHDDLGQRLVAVRLQLAALARAHRGLDLAPVSAILDDAHQTVRSLSFQLSPPILHELGLVAALRWLAGEMQARYGLQVELAAGAEPPTMTNERRFLLFRSVRELLINVVKHAGTDRARVEVRGGEVDVEITVSDAGRGYLVEPGGAPREHSRSFGLFSVAERVDALGGRLTIDSEPGRGTRVRLRLPGDAVTRPPPADRARPRSE
jgi:PAS domain S-box-containing protein